MMSVKHTSIPHEATPTRLIDEEEALSMTVAIWAQKRGYCTNPTNPNGHRSLSGIRRTIKNLHQVRPLYSG